MRRIQALFWPRFNTDAEFTQYRQAGCVAESTDLGVFQHLHSCMLLVQRLCVSFSRAARRWPRRVVSELPPAFRRRVIEKLDGPLRGPGKGRDHLHHRGRSRGPWNPTRPASRAKRQP